MTTVPKDLWVVVAAYNEGERIAKTLQTLVDFNTIVVDDGSRDQTSQIARQHASWVLRHPINCGQGAALQTGIDFALSRGAQMMVTFDADGQHMASEIPSLAAPILAGDADVVLGSRFLGETIDMPRRRRWLLKFAILFTRLTNGLKLTDVHNGFRCLSADAARRIRIRQPRMAHASEILDQIARLGLRYQEVPVTIRYSQETLEKGQRTSDALRIGSDLLADRVWK
ncbi:MAG: glycosyltransferase family 2 protein [Planctomycetota bacterium]